MRRLLIAALCFFCTSYAAAATDELSLRAELERRVGNLWQTKSIAELVTLSNELRTTRKRSASGIWQLSILNSSVESKIAAEAATDGLWEAHLKEKQRWAQQYPNAPLVQMLPARLLQARAWKVRGNEFASKVPPTSMAEFKRLTLRAYEALESVKSVASVDPTWYEMAISLSMHLNKSPQITESIFSEGASREPEFLQLYFVMSRTFDPKWGGSAQSLEAFINRALARVEPKDRDAMYARIYWWVSDLAYFRHLTDSLVDCERLARGARIVAQTYPDPWNYNNLAMLVGECGDLDTAKHFVGLIGDKPMPAVWGPGQEGERRYGDFRKWSGQ